MIQFVIPWSLRNWGTALAVVFAGLLFAPGVAEASCGDYLHGNGSAQKVDFMQDHATNVDGISLGLLKYSTPRQPCHGPGCSNNPSPRKMQNPIIVATVEQWALATAETLPSFLSSDNLLAEPSDQAVDGFRLSILRPPRSHNAFSV